MGIAYSRPPSLADKLKQGLIIYLVLVLLAGAMLGLFLHFITPMLSSPAMGRASFSEPTYATIAIKTSDNGGGDTWITSGGTWDGTGGNIFWGLEGGVQYRGVYRFELSGIPSGHQVDKATFYNYCNWGETNVYMPWVSSQVFYTENSGTWATQPPLWHSCGTENGVTGAGVWFTWDVTEAVDNAVDNTGQPSIIITMNVNTATDQMDRLDTAQAGTNIPYLNIIYSALPALPTNSIVIENINLDNYGPSEMIDSKVDVAGSNARQATWISAVVYDNGGRDNIVTENVKLTIYDGNGDKQVDNITTWDNYENIDAYRKKFNYTYNPSDLMGASDWGLFDTEVWVRDGTGGDNTQTRRDNDNFYVVNYVFNITAAENLSKHRTRAYGTIYLHEGATTDGADHVTVVDTGIGTYNSPVTVYGASDCRWENTYQFPIAASFYVYIIENGVDGLSSTVSYLFPNKAPGVVSIVVDNALVDRGSDFNGSGAVTATRITIVVEDNDNYDELVGVFENVRTGDDTSYYMNENLWSTAVMENENRVIVYRVLNPDDNTPDGGMGSWDVRVTVRDNYGGENTNEWQLAKFVVDDMDSTVSVDPAMPFSGWPVTVSGTVTRVSGAGATADNVIFSDNDGGGTLDLGAGNAWSYTYVVTAGVSENVSLTIKIVDSGLDGLELSSYLDNDNRLYQICIRWEENNGLVGGADNDIFRDLNIVLYATDSQYTDNMADNLNPDNYYLSANTYLVTLNVDNQYLRSIVPQGDGGVITLYMAESVDKLSVYYLTLYDLTGVFASTSGQLLIRRFIAENLTYINYDSWSADLTMTVWLMENQYYQFDVISGVHQRNIGQILADAVQSKTIWIRELIMDNVYYLHEYVSWSAYRDNATGGIIVSYEDNLAGTENGAVYIYDWNGTLVYVSTFLADEYSLAWLNGENDQNYYVTLTVTHDNFGTITETIPINLLLSEYVVDFPVSITALVARSSPFPLITVGSLALLITIALGFGASHASTGMLIVSVLAAGFWLFGWLPIPFPVISLLIVLAILWKLAERK